MAVSTAALEIILQARDDASASMDEAGKSFLNLGNIVKGAALGGLALAGGALATVGKSALDMHKDIGIATKDIAVQLGITREEAAGFEGTMTAVFANNFGENFQDIAEGVVAMNRNLGEVPLEWQQPLLEGAFAIRDAFGVDLNETMMATQTLVKNFGLTGTEALDFISAGFQKGLDTSGDFLDSINEYATQFGNAGADAGQFFSLMETGMQGGMLGTDKAADAFKEFRVRILDGSEATEDAVKSLFGWNKELSETQGKLSLAQSELKGLAAKLEMAKLRQSELSEKSKESSKIMAQLKVDELTAKYESQQLKVQGLTDSVENFSGRVEGVIDFEGGINAFFGAMRDGSMTSAEAFELAVQGLNKIEDPAERMQLGVALIGTQFEDLGDSFALNLDLGATKMEDLAGSTESLNLMYDNFGAVVEGTWRTFLVSLQPAMDALLQLANEAMPHVLSFMQTSFMPAVETLAGWMTNQLPEAIATVSDFWTNTLMPAMQPVMDFITGILIPAFEALINILVGSSVHDAIQTVSDFFTTVLIPAAEAVSQFFTQHVVPLFEALANVVFALVGRELQALADLWTDTLQPALSTVTESVNTTVKPALEGISPVFVAVGNALEPLGVFLDGLAGSLNTMAGEVETGTPIVQTLADLLGEKLPPIIQTLQEIIGEFVTAVSGFWSVHGETIQAVVEVAWGLIQTHIETTIEIIKTIIETTLGVIQGIIEVALGIMTGDFDRSWNGIKQIVESILDGIKGFIDATLNEVVEIINAGLTIINADWRLNFEAIQQLTDTVWNAIQILIDGILEEIKNIVQLALAIIRGDWGTALEELRDIWDTAWNTIKNLIEELGPVLVDIVKGIVDAIVKKFTDVDWGKIGRDLINGVKSGISKGTAALIRAIKALVDDMIKKFTDVDWGSIGSGIIGGITSGVKGAAGGLADAAKGAAQGALDRAKGFLGIGSPSRLWADEVGVPIVEGIALGITENADAILGTLIDAILEALEELRALLFVGTGTGTAHETGFDMMAAVAEGIRGGERILSETLGEVVGRVLDPILAQGLGEEFGQAVGAGMAIGLGVVADERGAPGTGPQPPGGIWEDLPLPGTGGLPWTPLPGTGGLPWADIVAPPDEIAEEIADNWSDGISRAVEDVQSTVDQEAPNMARAIESIFKLGGLGRESVKVAPGGFHNVGVWKEVDRFEEFLQAGIERMQEAIPRIAEALSGLEVRTIDISWFTEPINEITRILEDIAAGRWEELAQAAMEGLGRGFGTFAFEPAVGEGRRPIPPPQFNAGAITIDVTAEAGPDLMNEIMDRVERELVRALRDYGVIE